MHSFHFKTTVVHKQQVEVMKVGVAWAVSQRFSNNLMLFKTVITTKISKNKAILKLK